MIVYSDLSLFPPFSASPIHRSKEGRETFLTSIRLLGTKLTRQNIQCHDHSYSYTFFYLFFACIFPSVLSSFSLRFWLSLLISSFILPSLAAPSCLSSSSYIPPPLFPRSLLLLILSLFHLPPPPYFFPSFPFITVPMLCLNCSRGPRNARCSSLKSTVPRRSECSKGLCKSHPCSQLTGAAEASGRCWPAAGVRHRGDGPCRAKWVERILCSQDKVCLPPSLFRSLSCHRR